MFQPESPTRILRFQWRLEIHRENMTQATVNLERWESERRSMKVQNKDMFNLNTALTLHKHRS